MAWTARSVGTSSSRRSLWRGCAGCGRSRWHHGTRWRYLSRRHRSNRPGATGGQRWPDRLRSKGRARRNGNGWNACLGNIASGQWRPHRGNWGTNGRRRFAILLFMRSRCGDCGRWRRELLGGGSDWRWRGRSWSGSCRGRFRPDGADHGFRFDTDFLRFAGIVVLATRVAFPFARKLLAYLENDVVVQRTGVRLLLADTKHGQQIDDHTRLDLEFPR